MVGDGKMQPVARTVSTAGPLQQPPYLRWTDALQELLTAHRYAQQARRDLWDFAVTINELRSAGLTESDLRLLACEGYVRHAREVTQLLDDHRQFRPNNPLLFVDESCFILTPRGRELADSLAGVETARPCESRPCGGGVPGREAAAFPFGEELERPQHRSAGGAIDPTVRPCWDAARRELRLNGAMVKQFKWSASNQEIVLAAFQEEDWPSRVDDPLPPQPEQEPKRRLGDTIKCLNRHHRSALIRFRGDGTGEGVVWELAKENSSPDGIAAAADR